MKNSRQPSPARKSARWLRFSLKTALLLVTLYCLWLGTVTWKARKQEHAVKRIEELGGRLAFDFELDDEDRWRPNPTQFVPAWIRGAVGEEYFRRVAVINFDEGSDPSDADLVILRDVTHVRHLTLSNRSKVTDGGLAHIAHLSELRVLALNGTGVSGAGLKHVRSLRRLEGLTLDRAPVTNDALEHLDNLPNLRWLHLNDTRVTDDGLDHLTKLQSLEDLQLSNTDVTDAGLKILEQLPRLKRLFLPGTKTTHEGRSAFEQTVPDCRVSWWAASD